MYEEQKESMRKISYQIEDINKKIIKKNQIEFCSWNYNNWNKKFTRE